MLDRWWKSKLMSQLCVIMFTLHWFLPPANEIWSKVMFYTCVSFRSQGGSLSQHASQLTWQGVSVRGSLSGSLCPLGSLSRGVSVQGVSVWGVSVQGVSVQSGVSVWGVSVRGSLLGGSLSGRSLLGEGLCPGRSLSGRHPHMVISRQYTSYWNAFLFTLISIYYIFGYLPSTNLYYTY